MSLGVFPPLEFYRIVRGARGVNSSGMFGKIPMKSSGPGLLFVWSSLITASVSLGEICLFRFSDYSWFSFGKLHVSRNLIISSRLSRLAYSCSYFLITLCISLVSVVISPLSFLILFIWVLSLFFMMSLAKGLSILLSFQITSSWFY